MNKKPGSSRKPAKPAAKRKIAIKDLKAKNTNSVKGGVDGEVKDLRHKDW